MIYSKCPDFYQFVILCSLQKACSLHYIKLLKNYKVYCFLKKYIFFLKKYIFFLKDGLFLPMKTGINFILKFYSFLKKIIKLLDFNQWYGEGYQCQPHVQSIIYQRHII